MKAIKNREIETESDGNKRHKSVVGKSNTMKQK